MSGTPRPSRSPSRNPSWSGTPVPGASPARLAVAPPLRQHPSVSSLSVFSSTARTAAASPAPPIAATTGAATPPLAAMADAPAGILLAEGGGETEEEEIDVQGQIIQPEGDDESKRALREQLRQTLLPRGASTDTIPRTSKSKDKAPDIGEPHHTAVDRYPQRQYFVLTDAGKPVFISRPEGDDAPDLTSTIGIIQALISVFIDDGDRLRCINTGRTRITFVLRSPLYYACVSSWGEPESVTRSHLEYLHLQILSVVSQAQLKRIFERRGNFDLRRLLDGAENLLHGMLHRLEGEFSMTSSALQCLRLEPNVRAKAGECLLLMDQKSKRPKDILYLILVANGRVVTLARPRKHSIHPSDLHILLNTIHSPSILNSSAAATWLPVCLPKFAPAGFVNAYVSFLSGVDTPVRPAGAHSARPSLDANAETVQPMLDGDAGTTPGPSSVSEDDRSTQPVRTMPAHGEQAQGAPSEPVESTPSPGTALVCVSAGGDFETIRAWADAVGTRMSSEGVVQAVELSLLAGHTEYSVSQLGIPGLRHFIYKSRAHVQVTHPLYEDPYDNIQERRRLFTLYQIINDAIHAKSGQEETLKLQYIRTEKESVMGWITQPFELYIALSPRLPKSAVVGAANAVARWVKKEEPRLFLRDAPVF